MDDVDVKLDESGWFNMELLKSADEADARRTPGRKVDESEADTVLIMPPVTTFIQFAAEGDLVDLTLGPGDLVRGTLAAKLLAPPLVVMPDEVVVVVAAVVIVVVVVVVVAVSEVQVAIDSSIVTMDED